MSNNDNLIPNSKDMSEEGLNTLALKIMSEYDAVKMEDIQEAEVVEEPKQTNGIFTHTVESLPIWVEWRDGTYHKVNGFHGINRKPKAGYSSVPEILHVAPITTTVIGMERLEEVAGILTECGYELYSHGEMKQNKLLFIEMTHPDFPELEFPGTKLFGSIWIGSSHDGTVAFKGTQKVTDSVCLNTFMLNSASIPVFTAKHTRNADIKIKEYEKGIREAGDVLKQYYEAVTKLNDTPFAGRSQLERYFAGSIGAQLKDRNKTRNGRTFMSEPEYSGKHKNQINQLFDSYLSGVGQKERGDTLWSAFSAVTDWCDNHEANEKSRALGTNIIGSRERQKQRAWDLAHSLHGLAQIQ